MKRTDHKSAAAARAELLAHGHHPVWTPLGQPQKWRRLKAKHPEFVIRCEQRARSQVWHIQNADGAEQLGLLEDGADGVPLPKVNQHEEQTAAE